MKIKTLLLLLTPYGIFAQNIIDRFLEINQLAAAFEDALTARNIHEIVYQDLKNAVNQITVSENRDYTRIGNTKLSLKPDWQINASQLGITGWVDWIKINNDNVPVRKVGTLDGWFTNAGRAYLQVKSDSFSTVGVFIYGDHSLLNIGYHLDFPIDAFDELSPDKKDIIFKKCDTLEIIITDLLEKNLPPALTAAERLEGFVQFWTEVKYNFAFFDQVPDLDWDQTLEIYLPVFMADQSNEEYYDNLLKLCALLNDGHTNIYPPNFLYLNRKIPPIELRNIDGQLIIANIKENVDEIILGAEVVAINNTTIEEYLESQIYPRISASTEYIRRDWGARDLSRGKAGEEIVFELKLIDGTKKSQNFIYGDKSMEEWKIDYKYPDQFVFKVLENNIGYVNLGTFSNNWIVNAFEEKFDSINNCSALILDLRYNGGGSSDVGYTILKHFADEPWVTSAWRTREHRAAYKAWGKYLWKEKTDTSNLDEWSRKSINTYLGKEWYAVPGDTMEPTEGPKFLKPVVVLMGHRTASAAEDFLVAADKMAHFTTVGQNTFGSTGQPLALDLPIGGSARICTKKDTYPDGREFVGYGVKPDIYIKDSVRSFLSGEDQELKKALEILAKQ